MIIIKSMAIKCEAMQFLWRNKKTTAYRMWQIGRYKRQLFHLLSHLAKWNQNLY